MKYLDIHSHLNLSPLSESQDETIKALEEKGVGTITVGVDYQTSLDAVEIAQKSENLFACVGLHPNEATSQKFDLEKFSQLADRDKVVAIGECGLDYFRIDSSDGVTKEKQKEIFIEQIELSHEKNLPLVLHIRPQKNSMDAYEDALDILEKYSGVRGDVHFFVGNKEIAERFLKLGFYLSFTGVITFTQDYDEVIKMLPIENILTETDAPFVSPVPFRGKTCQPWMVEEVVNKIAQIKDLDTEKVRLQILENAKKLFSV